jgi:hypothetical protein
LGGTNVGLRTYRYNLSTGSLFTQPREAMGEDLSFGGIAVNGANQALIAFNNSSSAAPAGFISFRYAEFQTASDLVKAGEGNVTANRWGDFVAISTDANDIDYWLVHMYAKSDGFGGIWIASTLEPHTNVWVPLIQKP